MTTYRYIDGTLYACQDVGCPDLERARQNRIIISNKLFTSWWIEMEAALDRTPKWADLPDSIPHNNELFPTLI